MKFLESDFEGILPVNILSPESLLLLRVEIARRANDVLARHDAGVCRIWWHWPFRETEEVVHRTWDETSETAHYVERSRCSRCKKFWNVSYKRVGGVA